MTEDAHLVPAAQADNPRTLRRAKLFAAASVVTVVCVFAWANHVDRIKNPERIMAERAVSATGSSVQRPEGTSGSEARRSVPPSVSESTIQDVGSIVGASNSSQLLRRRVNLHERVTDVANDVAFWVGPGNNRVLVVITRDYRAEGRGTARQIPGNGIARVRPGQLVTITGTIQPLPTSGQRSGWGLTPADNAALEHRTIYIRAEQAIPEKTGY